jgi:hypothetical protein
VSDLWMRRIKLVGDSLNIIEPMLTVRRTLYTINHMDREVGETWLYLANIARKTNDLPLAISAVTQASKFRNILPKFALVYAIN